MLAWDLVPLKQTDATLDATLENKLILHLVCAYCGGSFLGIICQFLMALYFSLSQIVVSVPFQFELPSIYCLSFLGLKCWDLWSSYYSYNGEAAYTCILYMCTMQPFRDDDRNKSLIVHVSLFKPYTQFFANLFTWMEINPDSSVLCFAWNARVRPSVLQLEDFKQRS